MFFCMVISLFAAEVGLSNWNNRKRSAIRPWAFKTKQFGEEDSLARYSSL